jgi:hypothetical protein
MLSEWDADETATKTDRARNSSKQLGEFNRSGDFSAAGRWPRGYCESYTNRAHQIIRHEEAVLSAFVRSLSLAIIGLAGSNNAYTVNPCHGKTPFLELNLILGYGESRPW